MTEATNVNENPAEHELTEEEREAFYRELNEKLFEQQQLQQFAPIYETINTLYLHNETQGKVYNLTRGADELWRCIVHNGNKISESFTEQDGNISYQLFKPEEGEEVLWVYYHPEHRMIIRQTGYEVPTNFEMVHGSKLHEIYKGDDLPYFIGFLSDMACIHNVLNDEETVSRFTKAKEIANRLVGEDNLGINGFITNTLVKSGNIDPLTANWVDAKDISEVETLQYGVHVAADDRVITDFSNTAIFYYVEPPMYDTDGNQVEEDQETPVILRTAMLNEAHLPAPEPNSVSDFKVTLKVDNSWKAAILFTTTGIDKEVHTELQLFKRDGFDPLISNKI